MLRRGRTRAWAHTLVGGTSDARPSTDLREFLNAILYVNRAGAQWRYLPHDFPPWETVCGYFAKWQKGGVFAQLNGVLQELVRQKQGKRGGPSACGSTRRA